VSELFDWGICSFKLKNAGKRKQGKESRGKKTGERKQGK
jgi:hypothetical protein